MDEDKKIKVIQKKLQNWKFLIDDNVSEELQPLRNHCFFVMSLVDALLDVLIGLIITFPERDKLTEDARIELSDKIGKIIGPLRFGAKLSLAKDFKVIVSPLSIYIDQAEKLRNAFAHPLVRKYMPVIEDLKKKSNELKEWKNLEKIVDVMDELQKMAKISQKA